MSNVNFNYINLTPFKWYVLENFPFIEADFDALTNWQLFCKLGKEMNKIINSVNVSGEQVETLTTAFNNLQTYVNNYFNNLDVQEEINNKLDQMAEDGTLSNIINNKLLSNINNSLLQTYSLKNRHIICIGDSYLTGSTNGQQYATDGWADYLINDFNLTESYKFGDGGSGFVVTGHNGKNFITLITDNLSQIADKTKITDIICCGGYNDRTVNLQVLINAINQFINTCKTNFPNANIYIGCVGTNKEISENGRQIRGAILNTSLNAFQQCNQFGAFYLNGVQNTLKVNELISNDNYHPTPAGYKILAHDIAQAWITGKVYKNTSNLFNTSIFEIISGDINESSSSFGGLEQIINDNLYFYFTGSLVLNTEINLSLNTPIKLFHCDFKALKKVANSSFYFNQNINIGSNNLPTNSSWYIDTNNDIYVIFYSLPDNITKANRFIFNNIINIYPLELI